MRGRERSRLVEVERTSGRFCGMRTFQLFMIYIKIQEPPRSYFIGNQTSKKWNGATLFSLTPQPNTPLLTFCIPSTRLKGMESLDWIVRSSL